MKNKGLIITLIIVLIIIVIALINLLVLGINGKFRFFKFFNMRSKNVIFDETYKVESVDDLEIISTAGNVELKESTDGEIRVIAYGEDANDLETTLDNNKLRVDYSKISKKFIGFNFYINDIIVYLPKEYSDNIKIDAQYGDIDICELENATINVKEQCGDVKINKVKDVFIDNQYGDIEIDTVSNKCELNLSCGDVKINSLEIKEDSYITSSLGDVKILNAKNVYVDAKTKLGDTKISNNDRYAEATIKIENSCGDIKVQN